MRLHSKNRLNKVVRFLPNRRTCNERLHESGVGVWACRRVGVWAWAAPKAVRTLGAPRSNGTYETHGTNETRP